MRDGGIHGRSRGTTNDSIPAQRGSVTISEGRRSPPTVSESATLATEGTTDAPERVVVGIDFAPASLNSARWLAGHLAGAAEAGPRRRLDACLVHVLPRLEGAPASQDADVLDRELRAMRPAVLGGLAGFAASLRLGRARSVVRIGRPSAELARVVAAEGASLLVLGRRRDAGRQRVGEPNVIQRVVRRAASDVLVVPEGAPWPTRHVFAGLDAGPAAARVLARAQRLAGALGAALTLVHVLAPLEGPYERLTRRRPHTPGAAAPGATPGEVAYRDAAYGWLLRLASGMDGEGAGGTSQLTVAVGDAGREIAALAERHGPSVVVVGKRGADGAPPGSLGSVARELAARGPSPVLLVDDDAPRTQEGG